MSGKLTIKQERFVHEYLKCGNASDSYRVAYDAEKMEPETINRKAWDLLQNGKIRAMIEALRERMTRKALATPQRIRDELARIAFSNISDVIRIRKNEEGLTFIDVMPTDELDGKTIAAIAEIVPTKDGVKIKLHNKLAALELLGRDLGMFREILEISDSKTPEFVDPDPDI